MFLDILLDTYEEIDVTVGVEPNTASYRVGWFKVFPLSFLQFGEAYDVIWKRFGPGEVFTEFYNDTSHMKIMIEVLLQYVYHISTAVRPPGSCQQMARVIQQYGTED